MGTQTLINEHQVYKVTMSKQCTTVDILNSEEMLCIYYVACKHAAHSHDTKPVDKPFLG